MGWVKLDDGFFRHPKSLAAGSDARLLAIVALCWSGQYMTDGRIPGNALPALAFDAGLSVDDAQAAADRLVEVRMWAREPDGWRVHGWDDWQRSKEEREAKAQANADRQRRWRERKAAERAAAESRRDSPVSNALRNGLEAEAEAEAEAEVFSKSVGSEKSSSSKGVQGGTDDDDRVRAITDEIAQRKYAARLKAGKVRDDPAGYLHSTKANTNRELAAVVQAALEVGRTPEQIADDHAPKPTTSRAAAARARKNGAT